MSPEPYVRAQAFVTALILAGAAVVSSPLALLICSAAGAFVFLLLQMKYAADVRAAQAIIPAHRERLDHIVAGDAHTAFAIGLAVSATAVGFSVDPIDIGVPAGTPILAATTVMVIYLSSLVDWYIILPRISGLLGARPCKPGTGEPTTFPSTWRETTRWWYVHRIAAALTLRFGLAYAVAIAVSSIVGWAVAVRIVGGAVVAGLLSSYWQAIPAAVWEAGHPNAIVGQTIRHRATKREVWKEFRIGNARLSIPGRRRTVGPPDLREYVFDVSVEKIQVVPVANREPPKGPIKFEKRPRQIKLRDATGCEDAEPFTGCNERCSGINWYCIENPRCFRPK